MAWHNVLRWPRPTNFLHFMSLKTGTNLILLTQIINKVTAAYGILAFFTSFPLSALQLSMYIYSLPVLVATVLLARPIRAQSPWHCLAFAYLYIFDSLINAAYTAVFGVTWFVVLASDGSGGTKLPGGKMMGGTSGFKDPEHNVTQVEIVAQPKAGISPAQEAIAIGTAGQPGSTGLANAVLNSSSMMSIFIIGGFWILRVYAVLVVMAYARQVLRHHIQVANVVNLNGWSDTKNDDLADDPFSESRPQGAGLKGKMGRLMVRFGRSYWLGRERGDDDFQLRSFGQSKFRKSEDSSGTNERERRRRSGTGPPAPPPGLTLGS